MPSEVRFAALKRRLEKHGWTLDRTKGSHHVFKGEGRPLVIIPVHKGKVKPVYVRQVEAAIAKVFEKEGDEEVSG